MAPRTTPSRAALSGSILAFLALAPPGGVGALQEMPDRPCVPQEEPDIVSLTELWERSSPIDPGIAGAERLLQAARAEGSAVRRERFPLLAVEGMSNWGQRVSPGEERVLGVGERSELRALLSVGVLESGRGAGVAAAGWWAEEAQAGVAQVELALRTEAAHAFIASAVATTLVEAHREHLEALQDLEGPVRLRVDAGIEPLRQLVLLEQALGEAERGWFEALTEEARADAVLSSFADECLRARPIAPSTELTPRSADQHPEVLRLRRGAAAQEAAARAAGNTGRFSLQLFGSAGPIRSRAFDPGPMESEYLLGVSGRWEVDPAGVRGRRAEAERARAGALLLQADRVQRERERVLDGARQEVERADARRAAHAEEEAAAMDALRVARLRWNEGVGGWSEVVQAEGRLLQARRAAVEADRVLAVALLELAEGSGDLGPLPASLEGEVNR